MCVGAMSGRPVPISETGVPKHEPDLQNPAVDGTGVEPASLREHASVVFQPSSLTVRVKTVRASQCRRKFP